MDKQELWTLIAALACVVFYFIQREFSKKDLLAQDLSKFKDDITQELGEITQRFGDELRSLSERNTVAIGQLNAAIGNLTLTLSEQKAAFLSSFATHQDIRDVEDRLRRDFDAHVDNCPVRFYRKHDTME